MKFPSMRTVVMVAGISVAGLCLQIPSTVDGKADTRSSLIVNPCYTDGNHWYARATSGYGSNVQGTDVGTFTPTVWSTNSTVNGTWDQAAWANNDNIFNNALEVGFYSGFFPYDGTFTAGLQPYYTVDNGATGSEYTGLFVPGGTYVDSNAVSNSNVFVYTYGFLLNYTVGSPVLNDSQGEVVGGAWMGNGTGYPNLGWWKAVGVNGWNAWGYHSDCANSPYYIVAGGPQGWTSGGF